ncbi:hypothetical protein C0993_006791 [Termitomyces sp. T159_Od127]|nr:hypothetical protein C0993_006791 [Termitomyces sp. T159_Od127]
MTDLPVPPGYPLDPAPVDRDIESFPRAISSLDGVVQKVDVSTTFGRTFGFIVGHGDRKVAIDRLEIHFTDPNVEKIEMTAIFQLPFGTPVLVNSVGGYLTESSSIAMELNANHGPANFMICQLMPPIHKSIIEGVRPVVKDTP